MTDCFDCPRTIFLGEGSVTTYRKEKEEEGEKENVRRRNESGEMSILTMTRGKG